MKDKRLSDEEVEIIIKRLNKLVDAVGEITFLDEKLSLAEELKELRDEVRSLRKIKEMYEQLKTGMGR